MKNTTPTLAALFLLVIAACSSSKKTTTSVAATTPASPSHTATVAATPSVSAKDATAFSISVKPANGVYAPGPEELAAMQVQYKNVTLEKLKEGYMHYTAGACISCHSAKSIYKYDESRWMSIIDNMARRAKMTDDQKDAVYKYVLAIKATQPK